MCVKEIRAQCGTELKLAYLPAGLITESPGSVGTEQVLGQKTVVNFFFM